MSAYDEAIRLAQTEDPARRDGAFSDGWIIGEAVNGGVVMAAALTALGQHLAADSEEPAVHPDPVVLSAFFLTAARPGPFSVMSDVVRRGRTLSTGQVSLAQPGPDDEPVERMRAIASFGDLSVVETTRQREAPELPPPEQCVTAEDAPPDFLRGATFLDRVDLRLDPETVGWAVGRPSLRGLIRGWVRLRDGREPDTTMLFLALDALPPVSFDLGMYGWTPTLEFTGHVRRRPAPGWLRVVLSSDNVGGGLMEEDALVWDSTGALVAQARQLCGVPRRVPDEGVLDGPPEGGAG